jgi:hypothetical protein
LRTTRFWYAQHQKSREPNKNTLPFVFGSLAERHQIDVRWMSNQFLTRRQYASHYIITPVSKTGNKKNNTKQILMIYIHFFDNDILTFHYSTPFSNYESLWFPSESWIYTHMNTRIDSTTDIVNMQWYQNSYSLFVW